MQHASVTETQNATALALKEVHARRARLNGSPDQSARPKPPFPASTPTTSTLPVSNSTHRTEHDLSGLDGTISLTNMHGNTTSSISLDKVEPSGMRGRASCQKAAPKLAKLIKVDVAGQQDRINRPRRVHNRHGIADNATKSAEITAKLTELVTVVMPRNHRQTAKTGQLHLSSGYKSVRNGSALVDALKPGDVCPTILAVFGKSAGLDQAGADLGSILVEALADAHSYDLFDNPNICSSEPGCVRSERFSAALQGCLAQILQNEALQPSWRTAIVFAIHRAVAAGTVVLSSVLRTGLTELGTQCLGQYPDQMQEEADSRNPKSELCKAAVLLFGTLGQKEPTIVDAMACRLGFGKSTSVVRLEPSRCSFLVPY